MSFANMLVAPVIKSKADLEREAEEARQAYRGARVIKLNVHIAKLLTEKGHKVDSADYLIQNVDGVYTTLITKWQKTRYSKQLTGKVLVGITVDFDRLPGTYTFAETGNFIDKAVNMADRIHIAVEAKKARNKDRNLAEANRQARKDAKVSIGKHFGLQPDSVNKDQSENWYTVKIGKVEVSDTAYYNTDLQLKIGPLDQETAIKVIEVLKLANLL